MERARRGNGAAEEAGPVEGKGDGRCSEQRDTKDQPLGHQGGKPPWAAVANAQSKRGNQEHRGRWTGTATHQKITSQTHKRQQTENHAQEEGPKRELDVEIQGWPGDLSRASRCGFAVHCVSRSPA